MRDRSGYHSRDCPGAPACDGCGYITAGKYWRPGPTPLWARPFQRIRSELGRAFWPFGPRAGHR